MHDACRACGASFLREQGFYLGSIYINYGVTVIVTGALYALLVLVVGTSHETALTACLVGAVAFPILFFRYARSFLLALDGSVNRHQQHATLDATEGTEADRAHLAALTADDGRAGGRGCGQRLRDVCDVLDGDGIPDLPKQGSAL